MTFKTFLLSILSFLTLGLQAQSYNFSVGTGNYENLDASTSVNNGVTWDDPGFTIPIGFDFQYFDSTFNQLLFNDLGGQLGFNQQTFGVYPILMPYGLDLMDRGYYSTSASNISYKLVGLEGSRIFKLEWNNAGFFEEISVDYLSSDYINLQLWLYEGSNKIELHFGPKSISFPDLCFEGETGAPIGLFSKVNLSDDAISGSHIALLGNPSAPSVTTMADYSSEDFLSDTIPSGTIYKFDFVPTPLGTKDLNALQGQVAIRPNPASDYLQLITDNDLTIHSVSILNTTGQIIKQHDYESEMIDVSGLSAGIYFVEIKSKSGNGVLKFIKR